MGILEGRTLGRARGSASLACPSSLFSESPLMLCMPSRELVFLGVEGSLGLSFHRGWHPSRWAASAVPGIRPPAAILCFSIDD